MKTREGFVSNSSATSFCIYGAQLDYEKWNIYNDASCFARFLKKFKQEFPADYEKAIAELESSDFHRECHDKEIEFAKKIDDYKIADANQYFGSSDDDYYSFDFVDALLSHLKLERFGNSDMGIYVGQPWSKIEDEQTGAQFKLRVDEIIQSLFDQNCSTQEEAWADY